MYNLRVLLSLVILSFSTILYATDQIPEIFMYKEYYEFYYSGGGFGWGYPLYPLSKYKEYREKMNMDSYGEIGGSCQSTGCYRGYQGIWKIEDNTLFLSKLKGGCYNDKDVVNMKEVFGAEYTKHGLKAFWITDTMTLTDQPINVSTICNTFSHLTLIIEQGRIVKITEEGPYFAPKPEYIEDKYKLASNQLPEIMLYDNERFYAKGEWDPLSNLLTEEDYVSRMNKDEDGGLELSSCFSDGCYRSYQGIWEISKDTLYLKEVQDFCTQAPIFDLEKIFGKESVTSKGVRAFWINQGLIVSSKEISEFELKKTNNLPTYLKLNIVEGIVVKKEIEKD